MDYPQIVRDTIDFTSDTEVCNIGFCEGVLEDGRPYRIEAWSSYGVDTITIFLSKIDLDHLSEKELKKYLVDNKLIEVINDKIYITELEDSNDNEFISINVPLMDHDEVINKLLISLDEYNY